MIEKESSCTKTNKQKPNEVRTEEVIQSVKCLPCKHRDLIPRTHIQGHILVITALGRQRQLDHLSLLAWVLGLLELEL